MKSFRFNQFELLSLIILFEIGSSVVVGLGMSAKQDAWIAIIIGMFAGCALFYSYHNILKSEPKMTLVEIMQKNFGKVIGTMLGILYGCYFMYISGRVMRDFTELLVESTLNLTPSIVVSILFAAVICYGLYLGAEVLGRTASVFFIFSLGLWFIFLIGVVLSSQFHFSELQPVLEQGFKPVLKTAFPLVLTFPFGEMIVFTMFALYARNEVSFLRTCLIGIIISGVILVITIIINIGINGVNETQESFFPLLLTVSKLQLGDFINRLDPIVIALLIIGGFYKVVLFQWGAVQALGRSFQIQNYRHLILPVSVSSLIASVMMAKNFTEHINIGLHIVPIYIHFPFQIVIPLILLLFIKIKRK